MEITSLKDRSSAWLKRERPNAEAIKNAYSALHRKVENEQVKAGQAVLVTSAERNPAPASTSDFDFDDAEATLEVLVEAYQAAGGEIDDLLAGCTQQPGQAQPTPVQFKYDASSLIPEATGSAKQLSAEEKQAAFADLKQKMGKLTKGAGHEHAETRNSLARSGVTIN